MDIKAMQKAAVEAFKQKCAEIGEKYASQPMTPESFGLMEGEIWAAGQAAMQAAAKALIEAEDPKEVVLEKDGVKFRKKKRARTRSSASSGR